MNALLINYILNVSTYILQHSYVKLIKAGGRLVFRDLSSQPTAYAVSSLLCRIVPSCTAWKLASLYYKLYRCPTPPHSQQNGLCNGRALQSYTFLTFPHGSSFISLYVRWWTKCGHHTTVTYLNVYWSYYQYLNPINSALQLYSKQKLNTTNINKL